MKKKTIRDFNERNKNTYSFNTGSKKAENKLKRSEDYTNKITRDSAKFQDKIIKDNSKFIHDFDEKSVTEDNKNKSHVVKNKNINNSEQEGYIDLRYENKDIDLKKEGFSDKNYTDISSSDFKKNINSSEFIQKDKDIKEGQSQSFEVVDNEKKLRARKVSQKKYEENRKKEEELKKYQENIQKENEKENEKKYKEILMYDPLDRDTDNDGIADRYDNNFMDSDYFESTFDVEDNVHQKENDFNNKYSDKKNRSKAYKKRQYKDFKKQSKKENNTNTDNAKEHKNTGFKDEIISNKKTEKDAKDSLLNQKDIDFSVDRKTKKLNERKSRLIEKGKTTDQMIEAATAGAFIKSGQLIKNANEDDNAGADALSEGLEKTGKAIKKHSSKRNRVKKSVKKYDKSIANRKSKLEFKDGLYELRKKEDYINSSNIKKFYKRQQMKKTIKNKYNKTLKQKVKDAVKNTGKKVVSFLSSKTKMILLLLIALLILVPSCMGACSLGCFVGGGSSSTIATSYLSKPEVLKDINDEFSKMEADLQAEVDNVEKNKPDYDEYVYNNTEYIGHNVHELLSYVTARFGEVKDVSEIKDFLKELFEQMYRLEYKEKVETKYRTVTKTYVDENGKTYTKTVREKYEYKTLIITLHKKEMDTIVREFFADHPDNLKHYEDLFLCHGHMEDLFANEDLIAESGGIGGGGEEYEASTDIQKKIVEAAYITPSPGAGLCAMWVSQVYQNAGLGYIGGNACDMYRRYAFTSDLSKLKVGMLVMVESSSSGTDAGLAYGHVGIYIGDGKVMDNIGRVRITTLEKWIAFFCQHHPVGFGYPPSVQN